MLLNTAMDDVDYSRKNFNHNDAEYRHPLWLTESHFIYHLQRDVDGHLSCHKDVNGDPICSPRKLTQLSMHVLVCDPSRLHRLGPNNIPANLYPPMLTEAIFQRELYSVTYLISTWPQTILDLQSILPLEDYIEPDYLSKPLGGPDSMSILDCMLFALLGLKTESRLKMITFIGFRQDRKMCRELARLPVLWINPSERDVDKIYETLSRKIEISKDKVSRYINKIAYLYSNMDPYIKHSREFGPITLVVDCQACLDDVLVGLAMQEETPFRFACQRLWIEPVTDVYLPANKINQVLEPRDLTHLEIEDPDMGSNLDRFDHLLEGLLLLPNLKVLSLPNTLHVNTHPNATFELNQALKSLKYLRKLNVSSCYLKDSLDSLLRGITEPIEYLNLRDCRLSKTDIQFLLQWENVSQLQDLNLSHNNLKPFALLLVGIIHRMPLLSCFTVSYCSLTEMALVQIVRRCMECKVLKILGVQSFTPPPLDDICRMLQDAAAIPALQRLMILPEAYAFPGSDEISRIQNREHLVDICLKCLQELARPDIEIG